MRLTRHTVAQVREAVQAATGKEDLLGIGSDIGHGVRYLSRHDQTVWLGENGAAWAISYLFGIASAYGQTERVYEDAQAGPIVRFAESSQRWDDEARQLGEYHGRRARESSE